MAIQAAAVARPLPSPSAHQFSARRLQQPAPGHQSSAARVVCRSAKQQSRPAMAAASGATAAAAAPEVLHGVAQLPQKYRGVLLDQFGVLHDGVKPYAGAIDAVAALAARGVQLLIISNSSRRERFCLRGAARHALLCGTGRTPCLPAAAPPNPWMFHQPALPTPPMRVKARQGRWATWKRWGEAKSKWGQEAAAPARVGSAASAMAGSGSPLPSHPLLSPTRPCPGSTPTTFAVWSPVAR